MEHPDKLTLDDMLKNKALTRHSSTRELCKYFVTDHLKPEQKVIGQEFQVLVLTMLEALPSDTPELSAGLRKLLESKDCMVRASLPQ